MFCKHNCTFHEKRQEPVETSVIHMSDLHQIKLQTNSELLHLSEDNIMQTGSKEQGQWMTVKPILLLHRSKLWPSAGEQSPLQTSAVSEWPFCQWFLPSSQPSHYHARPALGLSCVLMLPTWGGPFPALHWVSRDQPPPPTLIPLHHPHTHTPLSEPTHSAGNSGLLCFSSLPVTKHLD